MANSYNLTVSATYSDGTVTHKFNPPRVSKIPTNVRRHSPEQVVTNSAEALSTGDLTAPARLHIRNNHASVGVDLGYNNSGTVGPFHLAAGEVAVIGIKSGDTVYAKAASATNVPLQIDMYDA